MAEIDDLLNALGSPPPSRSMGSSRSTLTREDLEARAPAGWADRLAAAGFNPEHHMPGTTPEEAARIPDGVVYDPRTNQYRDMRLAEIAMSEGRGRGGAALSGAAQGSSLGTVDEMMGALGYVEGGPAMANYRREEARARLDVDRARNPGAFITGEILGGIALPGGSFTKGAGWLANAGKAAGIGGALGALYSFNTREGGVGERARGVLPGAVFGAVGGAVSVPIGQAVSWAGRTFGNAARRVFGNKQYFRDGQLTQAGIEALQRAGLDPENVSAEFQRHFARAADAGLTPEQAGRAAQMDEFGIPAYRHNVTGSVDDAATFYRLQRAAPTPEIGQRAAEAADDQFQAAARAGDNIATGFSGGNAYDQGDAAVAVMGRLGEQERAARAAAGQAYDELANMGGGLRGGAVEGFGQRIRSNLSNNRVRLNETRTPNAMSSLDYIDDVFSGAQRGAVPFPDIEDARQQIVRARQAAYRGSNAADQRAMDQLIRAFDQEVEDAVRLAMVEGDEAVLRQAEKARSLWSDYIRQYRGDSGTSRFIQDMIDEEASPDQVTRWLFSAGRLGTGRLNGTLAEGLRDALGPDSAEWNMMRQAAFRQLITSPSGDTRGPQAASTELRRFFTSPQTRHLASTLFNEQERATIMRYSAALRQMVPPEGSVNRSGTSYESQRAVRNAMQGVAAMLGFASGGAGGGAAGAMALSAAANASERAALSNALRLPTPQPRIPVAGGAVGATIAGDPIRQELESRR